ncbi:hypothetical protein PPL_09767 [Heterostelium album PN500]|uniref:Protein translocase subunit SecA n=1 Tax=Heterostelium pallidum (strain ATCC 26659 / Pp 5 / PN500) TaxID=670386 RepID=D3BP05_HETP5|nr:hypothetical protein PPL_09767 [Heterostelium album PN500]EFA77015.1 hypothetical protein PPL_09767 [Heterostelium album PN500]|eukprot:XP_020429145.1 hypothetical protein PPL_09767 [Heterostelium album PN500]
MDLIKEGDYPCIVNFLQISKTLSIINGKDIHLLLGTGSVKTMITHYLCGENMITAASGIGEGKFVKKSKITIKKRKLILIHFIPGSTSGNEKISGKEVISYKITSNNELIITLDDQVPAIDLSIAIGVTKVIHSSKSVRPIIVLDKNTITSVGGSELGQILDYLPILIENIQGSFGSFSVLFTDFDSCKPEIENYNSIKDSFIQQIQIENQKNPNSNRATLLRFIFKGVENKIDNLNHGGQPEEGLYVKIVNPINTNAVQDILSMVHSRPPIENLSQVFKYNISTSSQTNIGNEIETLQDKINLEGGNYKLTAEYLDLIKSIAKYIDVNSLKVSYKDSLVIVIKHYNELCSDVKSYLIGALNPSGSLSIEQLDSHLSAIKLIYHLMKQRDSEEKTHFTNDIQSYDNVIQCLLQITIDCENSLNTIMSFSVLKDQIYKLCSLSDFNDVFTFVKSSAINSLSNRIQHLIDDANYEIRSHNWENSYNSCQSIRQSICIQEFIKIQIENEVQTLISSINKIIEISSEFINQILSSEGEISTQDLDSIPVHWKIIQTSSSFKPLRELINIEIKEVYYNPIVESIVTFTEIYNLSDVVDCTNYLRNISMLINMDANIKDRTFNSLLEKQKNIKIKIDSLKDEVYSSLNINSDQNKLECVFNNLSKIKELSQLDQYFSQPHGMKTYVEAIEEIIIFIEKVKKEISDSFTSNNHKLSNTLSQTIYCLVRQIEFGQNVSQEELKLIDCIENTKNLFKNLVSNICISFKSDDSTNGLWSTLSKQLEILGIFKHNQIFSSKLLITTFETKIVKYCCTLLEELEIYLSKNDYKSACGSLNQFQEAQTFNNIEPIVNNQYLLVKSTTMTSIYYFVLKMKSLIDDFKFKEFKTLKPQLNSLVDLEHYYPSINSKVQEINNQYRKYKDINFNIKNGYFSFLTEIDHPTMKILQEKSQKRLYSIQRDLSALKYEQVAQNLTWIIKMCSNSLFQQKLGTKVNNNKEELSKILKQIIDIAEKSSSSIKESLKTDNLKMSDIDHYYSIKTHLSTFINHFQQIDNKLIESLESYFDSFRQISNNIESWKKGVIEFNTVSLLMSKLSTLEGCQTEFSSCSNLGLKIPTHSSLMDQLKLCLKDLINTFQFGLETQAYHKCRSTILLVIKLVDHELVERNDYELLIQKVEIHKNGLFDKAEQYLDRNDPMNYQVIASEVNYLNDFFKQIPKVKSQSFCHLILSLGHKHIEELSNNWQTKDLNSLISILKEFKKFSTNCILLREHANTNIAMILDQYIETNGLEKFQLLGKELESSGSLGKEIISEFKQFQSYSISMWNSRSPKLNLVFEYILKNMTGDEISMDILKSSYDSFSIKHQEMVDKLKVNKYQDVLKEIVSNSKKLSLRIPKYMDLETSREDVINLLAHIFAIWTISKSGESYVALKFDPNVLLRPHHFQVLAIMRLLGIDKHVSLMKKTPTLNLIGVIPDSIPLDNHLIEILTGEGKSITLAVLSIILSLLGFKVSCVSYSEYLSKRDFSSFVDIFELFGVTDMITYSTFGELCESLISEGGDVRALTDNLIHNSLAPVHSQISQSSRILLIDEVDLFFGDSFYGKTYNPATTLHSSSIVKLYEYIWNNRKNIKFATLSKQIEYKNVISEFPGYEKLLSLKISEMVEDVNNYKNTEYEVDNVNKRIGYRNHDGISFTHEHGSKTAFAYIDAFGINKEDDKTDKDEKTKKEEIAKFENFKRKNLKITITCGGWSYANIPSKFERILGVTGTLKTLTPTLMKIIKDEFKINKFTFTPSIFDETKLDFKEHDHVFIEKDKDHWYLKIAEDILEKTKKERAVIVVFEDEKTLNDFETSHYFGQVEKSSKLVESTTDRDTVIKKATTSRQVTLITRSFGRGVDFIVNDDKVIANGGVHVIQTFLSEEITEEIQIKGRTARQGQKGSYKMILLKSDLIKMGMTEKWLEDEKKRDGFYKSIDEKRQKLYSSKCEKLKKVVNGAKERDSESNKYLSLLSNYSESKKSEILKILFEFNNKNK